MNQAVFEIDKPIDYEPMYKQLKEKCAEQAALIAKLQKEGNGKGHKVPPFSNLAYDFLTSLQYKVKSLTAQVSDFQSGEKYVKIQAEHKSHLATKDREIKKLKHELADVRRQVIDVRNKWMQTNEDLVKEHAKELARKDRNIEALEKQLLDTRIMLDAEKGKFKDKSRELYQVMTELEEEKGKNLKLTAQVNRDYENSSKPSSTNPNHKKIVNNREKTGKLPGGQFGHKGHPRKKHTPTNVVEIPAPAKYANNPGYKLTGRTITKQLVDIHVDIVVTEYFTSEYRNVLTGQRVHADFPAGMVNEVTYSGNVKSFAFLLNNHCNVSIAKVSDFLSELTGGELKISTGMINGLSRECSLKTEPEQKESFTDLLLSPVMSTDFATVRVNGKNKNVAVCATPSNVMYFAKEHKGHEGIKGTPVEDYQHTLVHDHDKTYYNYGGNHSECNEHPLRYLKDGMENEPDRKWAGQMRGLIQEMIHFRKNLDPSDNRDPDEIAPDKVKAFEDRYDEILGLAKEEYEYEPPTKYYKDGYNLYKKLEKYKAAQLLFLHDRRVPATNNLAERLLRVIKRKLAQVMTFRSFDSLDYLCRSLGTVASMRAQGSNLYEGVASIYDRATKYSGCH